MGIKEEIKAEVKSIQEILERMENDVRKLEKLASH